jgi:hypothetical protein
MIGGDFQINPSIFGAPDVRHSPISRISSADFLLDTGRSAIAAAISLAIKSRRIKEVWMPYYCCKTMIRPFVSANLKVNFYSLGERLDEPVGLPNTLSDCIFLYLHYFGRRNNAIELYLQNCKTESAIIIEDVVQSCMNVNHGETGDFVVHSLRKFLPVPDGSILSARGKYKANFDIQESNEEFVSKVIIAKLMRFYSGSNNAESLTLKNSAEEFLNTSGIRSISNFTLMMLPKFDLDVIQNHRLRNYEYLLDAFMNGVLGDHHIRPLFPCWDKKDVPLTFPVMTTVEKRNMILEQLKSSEIFCPVHWCLDKPKTSLLETEFELSKKIFSIPIDHRVNLNDLNKVIDKLSVL